MTGVYYNWPDELEYTTDDEYSEFAPEPEQQPQMKTRQLKKLSPVEQQKPTIAKKPIDISPILLSRSTLFELARNPQFGQTIMGAFVRLNINMEQHAFGIYTQYKV
jgi:hypothetical protein